MTTSSLIDLANKMLDKFGQECYIYTISKDVFNKEEGEYTKIETEETGKFAFLNSLSNEYKYNFTLDKNEKLMIISTLVELDENSEFLLNGIRYKTNKTIDIIFKDKTIVKKIIVEEKR